MDSSWLIPMHAPSYTDLAIRRQAMLERIKTAQVKDYLADIKGIESLIRQTLAALDEDVSELSYTRLNKLIAGLQKDQAEIFRAAHDAFIIQAADISALAASQEILDLKKTVDLGSTKLKSFTKKEVFAKVIKQPLMTEGELLSPWIKKYSAKEITRVSGVIRSGHAQGKTNQELVRQIMGTKSHNYKNGILDVSRRHASTVVRTSVQHVSSAARQEVWKSNSRVIKSYEFLATLDRKTSRQCKVLDGQEFKFGEGPIPPIHPNCRSTTVPILDDKYKFLTEGETRSGESGPVPAEQSYYQWLNGQSKQAQIDALGPTRAKLFRDGGMSADRFRELQFDTTFSPLTLDQMRVIEPEAFKLAGI